jgi:ATP-dependent DNA ligase
MLRVTAWAPNSVIRAMSAARPLSHRKRKSSRDLAMSHKCQEFAHACEMGLEGIVSKRKDSAYRSGRSPDWLKSKNVNKFFGSALSVALQVMSRQHEDARFRAFVGSHLCCGRADCVAGHVGLEVRRETGKE